MHNHYRLLGGYRALLAILVLVSHTHMWLPTWVGPLALGNVGVLSFFVLSRFVIAEACDIFYPGRPVRFLTNRLLRIYPTYWAACGIAIAIYVWIPHPEFNPNAYDVFANLTIVLAERMNSNELRLISVIWAVGIELRFYVLAALIDYVDRLMTRRGNLQAGQLMAAVGVVSLALYFYSWTTDFGKLTVLRFAPFFVFGFVYYRWVRYQSVASLLLGLLALLTTAHSYNAYISLGTGTSTLHSSLIFLFGLILFVGLARVTRAPKYLERIDKRLGDLTYSIYLVHWPIVYAVGRSGLQGYEAFIAALMFSLGASAIIVSVVEKPLLQLRDSIRRARLYS